ncbi:MAG: hypothetical protein RI957_767 [Verrucomicrobiota bacterium]|jgi:hypothetical protein
MKKCITHLSVLAALGFGATAYSQISVSQNVTIALVETTSEASLPAKDQAGALIPGAEPVEYNSYSVTNNNGQTTTTEEGGTKMVATRISNKEVLQDLVEAGVIDSIVGYSIQLIGSPDEDGYVDSRFHVVKRGEAPIDISEYLYADSYDDEVSFDAETYSYRRVEVDQPARVTETGKAAGKEAIVIAYVSPSTVIQLHGVANWSESIRTVGTAPNQVAVWVPGSASVTSILGGAVVEVIDEQNGNTTEGVSLIEGRFSVSAGLVTITPPAQ